MTILTLCFQSLSRINVFSKTYRVFQRPWTPHPGVLTASCALHVDSVPTVPTLTTSYVHGTSSSSLLYYTVGEILQRMTEHSPDKEAAIFFEEGIRKTFAQLQQDVDQLAAGLLALGLTKGDRLGIWMPNIYHWIVFQFAAAKAGIILVTVNTAYQKQEVEFLLQKTGCKAIACTTQFKNQKYCEMLRQICPEIESSSPGNIKSERFPDLRSVIVLDSHQLGMFHFDDVMEAGSSQYIHQLQDLQKKLSCEDPLVIYLTSGTTGASKGAVLSHFNIVNNSYFFGKRLGFDWRPNVRFCKSMPIFHCFGSIMGGISMAMHGVTLVIPSAGYDVQKIMAALQGERCNFLSGSPTLYVDLIHHPDLAKYDLSSVEIGIIGGAPCQSEIIKKVVSVTGIKDLIIGYGSTECCPGVFTGHPDDNLLRKREKTGIIIPHSEAKIVDPETGDLLPLGQKGEIMIRSPYVMLGYWNDPTKTEESITKTGWYKTGDVGRLDAYGYLEIGGRLKDMIIRGGLNIYPSDIEQFLNGHPKVQDVHVVGVEDQRMGEELCACIKLVDGQDCTEEEIKAHCKGKIPPFQIPRYVLFVTSYPFTASGKVTKFELRKEAEKMLRLKGKN
ncbi:medium-chain acyl-CoA ligase ACSF2, mitochondrial isoform X2 [Antennarius striatus]|uniref:medium-chain acyl-CoA ligase ACSF2, mitochondrial isoform X2 n=1 Tax=Antennarius striatus TaxID=241820 RepID=UPI0035B40AB7